MYAGHCVHARRREIRARFPTDLGVSFALAHIGARRRSRHRRPARIRARSQPCSRAM